MESNNDQTNTSSDNIAGETHSREARLRKAMLEIQGNSSLTPKEKAQRMQVSNNTVIVRLLIFQWIGFNVG